MALLIGQPMNARDLEQVTSSYSLWPPERFAAMCNALAWAVSWTTMLQAAFVY